MLEIIAVSLLAFVFIQDFFNRRERQKLVEALIARNLKELGDLETTRQFKPSKAKDLPKPDTLVSNLDDKTFDKYIKSINEKDDGRD